MAYIKNWFSNMLPMDEPLIYADIEYKTVENFYQAMKFPDYEQRKHIASLDPYAAKRYVKGKEPFFWKDVKLFIMEFALRAKFKPGTSWYEKLMATGEEPIIEYNNWGDTFWGMDSKTFKGENHLGKLLMKIRDEYKPRRRV